MNFEHFIQAGLQQRQHQHRYRSRPLIQSHQGIYICVEGSDYLNFCSNDYLGFSQHPKVLEAFHAAANQWGVGSTASHLVCGHSHIHHALETQLAEYVGAQRALIFSTGYMANLGVVAALLNRQDALFQDKLNHASLVDATQLSGAELFRFKHLDTQHLEQQLIKASNAQKKLVVVDGVFSMDGDIAPLPEIVKVCAAQNAWLMVDDAHGLGILGDAGQGILQHLNLSVEQVPIYMGTFGKALGTAGAFVAGSQDLIEYLIQFARTYIYTTAMPPAVTAATQAALNLIHQEPEWRLNLLHNIQYFKQLAQAIQLPLMPSDTPIQPLFMGDELKALQLMQHLKQQGFWITAIRPPTVPQSKARLRITLSALHTQAHIEQLIAALSAHRALWS